MKNQSLSISENIRSLREKKGYSQENMSEMLNISQQTYSLTEKNPEKTNLSRIQEIAKILDVKISFLLNEEDAFVLNSFYQAGGNNASYIHSVTNDELHKKIIDRLEKEVSFLKNIIESKLVVS